MNAQGRKQIAELISQLESLREQSTQIAAEIQSLADAEREKFDNMSEGLQQTESGQRLEEIADQLESAVGMAEDGSLTDAIDELEGIC